MSARTAIRDAVLAQGFDAVGFCAAGASAEQRARLKDFLAQGYHGDMGWMEARADERSDPQTLWPAAKTAIVAGLNYGPCSDPLASLERRAEGVVSVYAQGRDYHDLIKPRLKQVARLIAEQFGVDVKVFVDTAPVMEKPLAERAGLGWQGKHTNLVSRGLGSWLFLGVILTTLDLEPDRPEGDHCGACTRCLDVCPTAAFPAPYRLDARRCISYLTIEHKGPVPRDLRPLMGNRIYGCDDCLAVCPWNKFARHSPHDALKPREGSKGAQLAELVQLDDAAFRKRFAGSPVKRTGRDRFIRNVLIAIGNSGAAGFAPEAERLLADGSALVRGAAVWALSRLLDRTAFAALRARHALSESDAQVRVEWDDSNVPESARPVSGLHVASNERI